jgi:hypothetical protein
VGGLEATGFFPVLSRPVVLDAVVTRDFEFSSRTVSRPEPSAQPSQGLNEKLEQKETEITELKQTSSELKEMVKTLDRKLKSER